MSIKMFVSILLHLQLKKCLLICLLSIQIAVVAAENPTVEIVEAVWTNGVDLETKQPLEKYVNTAPRVPLHLWMKIRGNSEFLAKWREEEKFPIRHKWFSYIGTRPYFDDTRQPVWITDSEDSKTPLLNKLGTEVSTQGFFEWQCWTSKLDVRPGWWRIDVVYIDNTPVLCSDQPCVYSILVE